MKRQFIAFRNEVQVTDFLNHIDGFVHGCFISSALSSMETLWCCIVKFEATYNRIHSRKCIWNRRLQNISHFVQAALWWCCWMDSLRFTRVSSTTYQIGATVSRVHCNHFTAIWRKRNLVHKAHVTSITRKLLSRRKHLSRDQYKKWRKMCNNVTARVSPTK